jgi:translocator protein
MTLKSAVILAVFIGLVAVVSTTGSMFRPGSWYEALAKPSWTPPGWLFPPVWAVLYLMIAIAGWRVYMTSGLGPALAVWLIGLMLNGAWSYIMFGQQQIGVAALDIVALWVTIVAFIALTWNGDRVASLLFVPYLVWVSYAAVLNIEIYRLNPTA